MHRPGRIGGNELDVDALAAAYRRITESGTGAQYRAQLRVPDHGGQLDIDKPRPRRGDGEAGTTIVTCGEFAPHQSGSDPLAKRHWVFLEGPRQDHCRVGREIAVGRIARQLDRDPAEIELRL